MWCEVGGTSLPEQYGVYRGYMGRATKCTVMGFFNDELDCWHCKKTIGFGDDYASAYDIEVFCLQCVTENEPEPQFQVEKRELGYG